MFLAFDGLKSRVSLRGCDTLISPLAAILGSWRFRIVEADERAESRTASILVRNEAGTYRITSAWLDKPIVERTEVGAVFSLAAELACAFAGERPGSICLHCAAVEANGRLLVFPSSENAGKSTLAARLAARGLRIFADDVLPLSESGQEGASLGVAPRLRLPLPCREGTPFHDFITTHRGPHDEEFLYLSLSNTHLALHGQTAPLGATIFLDRRRSAAAELRPLARGLALRQLIIQNFAPDGTSVAALERLCSLVERTACFSFTYSDLDEAAESLSCRFSTSHAPWLQKSDDECLDTCAGRIPVDEITDSVRPHSALFVQTGGVTLRAVGEDIFLVKPGDAAIYHLNAVAANLWRLLEQPITLDRAIHAVRQAFPHVDTGRVKRDVRSVFVTLRDQGLIRIATR